jgi:hypothetical protein
MIDSGNPGVGLKIAAAAFLGHVVACYVGVP